MAWKSRSFIAFTLYFACYILSFCPIPANIVVANVLFVSCDSSNTRIASMYRRYCHFDTVPTQPGIYLYFFMCWFIILFVKRAYFNLGVYLWVPFDYGLYYRLHTAYYYTYYRLPRMLLVYWGDVGMDTADDTVEDRLGSNAPIPSINSVIVAYGT